MYADSGVTCIFRTDDWLLADRSSDVQAMLTAQEQTIGVESLPRVNFPSDQIYIPTPWRALWRNYVFGR